VTRKHFSLVAWVSTDNPASIKPVLERLITKGSIKEKGDDNEFLVEAEMDGESVKELNRSLLSTLRKVEKITRLRAEWIWGNTKERFFDYMLQGVRKGGA